jgi:gliding motility-associated protein GldC
MQYSEIKLKVGLNEHKIPADIKWMATDSERSQFTDCKAFNLSIWDPVEANSLSINLWTDTMQTDEMHSFFFRSLIQMSESYQRATANPFVKDMMNQMVTDLIKKTADWENNKENS